MIAAARGDEIVPSRGDVRHLDHARGAKLALHVQVPLLHPWRLEIALVRRGGLRDEEREVLRERIADRQWRQARTGDEDAQVEVRRIEIESFRRRERALVVVD